MWSLGDVVAGPLTPDPMNDEAQNHSRRVYNHGTLASLDLTGVVAARTPLSVVFGSSRGGRGRFAACRTALGSLLT